MRLLSFIAVFLIVAAASLPQASAQSSPDVFEAETFSLENGLQVVVIPQRRVPVVTHILFYKAGGADEERGQSGIAHFFEHLMFKATKNHEAGAFEAAVKAVGGSQNAFTTSDFTAYFEQVPPSALKDMMAFEADRMRNLVLSDDAIETERRVVMEERLMRVDNDPSGILREAVGANLFHNHPYGTPVIGWMHEIEKLTKEQLQTFYDRYYRPNNAVLVVAGDVDAETVRKLAEETYGKLERGPDLPPRIRPMEPDLKVEQVVILRDPRVTLPSFSRNWFGPAPFGENEQDADALVLLSTILGGGERSRLHQELVVKRQIASSAGAWTSMNLRDYSQMGVYASPIDPDKLREVQQAVDKEIEKMASENVSEHELETAKKVLASQLIFSWERQMSRALEVGTTLMVGGTLDDVASIRERIDAVTADQIREAAQRYLSVRRSVAGYLLPVDAEDPA